MTLCPADHSFLAALEAALPGVIAPAPPAYLEEPRGRFAVPPTALARPRNTGDVQAILRAANAARVGVVPFGGGTGLVGGQVRPEGPAPLILSLERMNHVRALSAADQTMVAEAGMILADVQAAAEAQDLLFPLSLASEGTARIGGNLATNAGGVNVLRWGNARDLCLGLEAVLPDGTLISGLKSLRKDNTGYDLRHLLIGSEGSLAVITAARLRLFPRPAEIVTGLLHIANPDAALHLLRALQDRFGETVSAFELINRAGIDFIKETLPDHALPPTGTGDWLALVELGGSAGARMAARAEAALADLVDAGLILDGHLAQNAGQRAQIWAMRETIPEANKRVGAIASHDISVPVSRIPAFIAAGAEMVAGWEGGLRLNCFGHMGDGNLHYNVYPPKGQPKADYAHRREGITRAVHDLVADFDGSISAEHGIGRAKRDDLRHYGDPGKLAAMAAIKRALDPHGIMNPGAVIEA